MRVLIADDHAMLRKGLIQILSDALPHAEFGETATAAETIDRLSSGRWSVVLLDIFLPGRSGLEVLQVARQQHPHVPVLVVSSAPEDQMADRVLRAGAAGYLSKQAAPEELVRAVERVTAGRRYVSAETAERLATALARPVTQPHEQLTVREFDVLRLLMTGRSVKEIADALDLSPKTVSTYHTRIWEKCGVQNDVELTRYVMEHRLLDSNTTPA